MASYKYGSNGKITQATVYKGDTLSEIAEDILKKDYVSEGFLDVVNTYQFTNKIAEYNKLTNKDCLYLGQKLNIPLFEGADLSKKDTTGSATVTYSAGKAKITAFGLQSDADSTLYAIWEWNHETDTENYKYEWQYYTADKHWFMGTSSTTEHKQCTYTIPSNALMIRFRVRPIAKTDTVDSKSVSRFTAEWAGWEKYNAKNDLSTVPAVPTVKMEKYKLTASLTNLDLNGNQIEFQIRNMTTKAIVKSVKVTIVLSDASCAYTCTAGNEYKVRCRQVKGKLTSDWSDWSEAVITAPSAPKIEELKAIDETSVRINWSSSKTAKGYDVEYTTQKRYFDSSSEVQKFEIDTLDVSHAEITQGIDPGNQYFFRVRAKNDQGKSGWSSIKSINVGTKPSPPTTWSSKTTAVLGEIVNLYWNHNTEDGSSQTYAKLSLTMNGTTTELDIKNTTDEEEKDKTSVYRITRPSDLGDGTLEWKVQTRGITDKWSDWSIVRTVTFYEQPTVELRIVDENDDDINVITGFPFYIKGLAGPNTQMPIGYHVDVCALEDYETVDNLGNTTTIKAGDSVYSKFFDISGLHDFAVGMSASNIDLQSGVEYVVKCTAAMNSGLTAEAELEFSVNWSEIHYQPNARIAIDDESYVAYITPYCDSMSYTNYIVEYDEASGTYTRTNTLMDIVSIYIERLDGVYTTTGEQVYSGATAAGIGLYLCEVHTTSVVEDVLLSVYRKEYDGTFTELMTGIESTSNTTITDPHPALDYARYRIVATSTTTGAVSYYDISEPVGGKSIIIQWDESWTTYDTNNEDPLVDRPWGGSMLRLPYNIDVSDSTSIDVEHVRYIGRKHPVSYYGTHVGETASWSTAIPKSDIETIYALRRLAKWMGDVYVREPSGVGYWATISVSFSQKHCDMVVPISLSITRVEGGA